MTLRTLKTAALCSILLASGVAYAGDASAEVRTRQATITNNAGKTATGTRTVDRTAQSRQTTGSVQTGAGKGFTRSMDAGYNAETGAYNNRSITTHSGETVSRNSSANCAGGVCSRSTVATGTGDQTVSRSKAGFVDENGNYITSGAVTGPDGQTATRNVTRSGEGEKTTTVTDANGESRSRTRWITVE